MRKFKVGTFFYADRHARGPICKSHVNAYMHYSPTWKACIEYEIEAKSGADARRVAIERRMEHETALRPPAKRTRARGRRS